VARLDREKCRVDANAAAGWSDASIWEEARRKGDDAVHKLINDGLQNTTVTVVLIGAQTKNRKYVRYEIEQSLKRGNGLLGIYIHMLRDRDQKTDSKGDPPQLLIDNRTPCYDWDSSKFGSWVEGVESALTSSARRRRQHRSDSLSAR
jgi:hypothetical protein